MNENFDIMTFIQENSWEYLDMAVQSVMSYWPKIIWALLVLWIGFKIIKMIINSIEKTMEKANIDQMLKWFIRSLTSIILKILVIISAAGIIGIQTSSFVAILAAAWLAIGLALSWTLQNFAAWIMILFLKYYNIWDYIEWAWYGWTVKEIHIFNTVLITPDRKTIIIPNSELNNSSIVNYSVEPIRRLEIQVWVGYNDDIDLVKTTLRELFENDERVINDEWITVVVNELWDNAVIFSCRAFCKWADLFGLRWDMLENIKKTFDKKLISFPFPQRDLHIYNEK